MKRKRKIINDNKKIFKEIVSMVYDQILKLDTKTLHEFSFEIYKELINRKDFIILDDEIVKFQILYDDLKNKGVDISCLI